MSIQMEEIKSHPIEKGMSFRDWLEWKLEQWQINLEYSKFQEVMEAVKILIAKENTKVVNRNELVDLVVTRIDADKSMIGLE